MECAYREKSWSSPRQKSFLNNYGTPLCLKRPISPKRTLNESDQVLTFLSPRPSSAGMKTSSIGYSRKRGSPISGADKTFCDDIEDVKSLDEHVYLVDPISSRETGGERLRTKRKTRGSIDVFKETEEELKPLSYFIGSGSRKRRRLENLLGVSAKCTTDWLHYGYKMIDY